MATDKAVHSRTQNWTVNTVRHGYKHTNKLDPNARLWTDQKLANGLYIPTFNQTKPSEYLKNGNRIRKHKAHYGQRDAFYEDAYGQASADFDNAKARAFANYLRRGAFNNSDRKNSVKDGTSRIHYNEKAYDGKTPESELEYGGAVTQYGKESAGGRNRYTTTRSRSTKGQTRRHSRQNAFENAPILTTAGRLQIVGGNADEDNLVVKNGKIVIGKTGYQARTLNEHMHDYVDRMGHAWKRHNVKGFREYDDAEKATEVKNRNLMQYLKGLKRGHQLVDGKIEPPLSADNLKHLQQYGGSEKDVIVFLGQMQHTGAFKRGKKRTVADTKMENDVWGHKIEPAHKWLCKGLRDAAGNLVKENGKVVPDLEHGHLEPPFTKEEKRLMAMCGMNEQKILNRFKNGFGKKTYYVIVD